MRLLRISFERDLKESAVRNSAPLLPSDLLGISDEDGVVQDFADYIFKTRRPDGIAVTLLRATVKALVSGLVHHALTDVNTVVFSLLSQ